MSMPNAFPSIHTIAIVGASNKPERPSYQVMNYFLHHGFTVIPVNPHETTVLGQTCYPTLQDIPHNIHLDLVDIFRRSEAVEPIIDAALARNDAHTIWMQLGVENETARRKAEAAGKAVVMNACLMTTHQSAHDPV